jgi:hypothetical protein
VAVVSCCPYCFGLCSIGLIYSEIFRFTYMYKFKISIIAAISQTRATFASVSVIRKTVRLIILLYHYL